jgi:hypothetical protein
MASTVGPSLAPVNTIIKDTLVARLASITGAAGGPGEQSSVPSAGLALTLSLCEFDDARYLLTASAESPATVEVSLALPCDPTGTTGAQALPAGAAQAAISCYAAYATLAASPVAGYAVTLILDLAKFPTEPQARLAEAERVASLRAVVSGAPLRALLTALAAGEPGTGELVAIPHRCVALLRWKRDLWHTELSWRCVFTGLERRSSPSGQTRRL